MAISKAFSDGLAARLGADPNRTWAFVSRWEKGENTSAQFNPLATTQSYPGATDFNGAHVKNYPSEDAGINATFQTLTNGRYPDIVNYLTTGQANTPAMAQQMRTWGTTSFADDLARGNVPTMPLSQPQPGDPNWNPGSANLPGTSLTPGQYNPGSGSPGSGSGDASGLQTYRDPVSGQWFYYDDYFGAYKPFDPNQGQNGTTPAERSFEFNNLSAWEKAQQALQQARDSETAAHNRAVDLQNAGELDRARAADQEASHWHDVQAQLSQEGNAVTARGQDLNFQSNMAQISQAREASTQRWQADMAGATNDAQRNEITARWNQEQAAIAQMEDETKRILGSQANQTAQFGAETNRAVGMGNLGLDTDKFLLQAASTPRDLFGQYFLQRGLTPDWNTMSAGGQLPQGQPIVPVDPMKAYVPVTAPPTFNGTPQNQYIGKVGQATAAGVTASQQSNPFITSSPMAPPGGFPMPSAPAPYTPAQIQPRAPAPATSAPVARTPQAGPVVNGSGNGVNVSRDIGPVSPSNNWSGVRNEDVANIPMGGWGSVTTGGAGTSMPGDYANFDVFGGNQQPWDANTAIPGGTPIWLRRRADGGFTNDRVFMAGDAPLGSHPAAYGARPEVIENPTGAPLRVIPNPQTMGYGVRRYAYGSGAGDYSNQGAGAQWAGTLGGWAGYGGGPIPTASNASPGAYTPAQYPASTPVTNTGGGSVGTVAYPPQASAPPQGSQLIYRGPINDAQAAEYQRQQRAALAAASPGPSPFNESAPVTNIGLPSYDQNGRPLNAGPAAGAQWDPIKQQYLNLGQGNSWINSSDNAHLAGMELPDLVKKMAAYGVPIPPYLAAVTTGGLLPTMNFASAFQARGGGALPSLQGVNNLGPGEMENYKGYVEGPVGVPWADMVDYIGRGTASLKKAQRAA